MSDVDVCRQCGSEFEYDVDTGVAICNCPPPELRADPDAEKAAALRAEREALRDLVRRALTGPITGVWKVQALAVLGNGENT